MADERKPIEDVMYDPVKSISSRIRPDLTRLGDAGLMSTDQQEKVLREIAPLFLHQVRLGEDETAEFHRLLTSALLNPPSEEQVDRWGEESRRTLRERHGAAEAERLAAQTRAFIAKHPKLKAMLDDSAIGNHPKVVEILTERARRAGQL